jgi:citrate synthase
MVELWKTSITKVEPNKLTVRGYPLDMLISKISFADAIYLIIKGELPSRETSKLMEAVLVSSIDHGVTPPSTLAARTVASTGSTFNAALAAGVLSINQYHGGAIGNCMEMLTKAVDEKLIEGKSYQDVARNIVMSARRKKEKIAGFGHRVHTADPRTARLYEVASETGFEGEYVKMAVAIEEAIVKETGKNLPINVDGAIASLLCELRFPPALGNAIFILARLPGLTAHVYEEITTQKPMRHINASDHAYNGEDSKSI